MIQLGMKMNHFLSITKDYIKRIGIYKLIFLIVITILAIFILGKAYYSVVSSMAPNSDNAYEVLISKDIANGNIALKGWYISQDNFILNEIPLYVIGIKLVGYTPKLMDSIPVILYLLILLSGAFLSIQLLPRGRKWLSLTIFASILVFGTPSLFSLIMVSSLHAGTILFSLLSLISVYYYLQTEKTKPWLIFFLFLLF